MAANYMNDIPATTYTLPVSFSIEDINQRTASVLIKENYLQPGSENAIHFDSCDFLGENFRLVTKDQEELSIIRDTLIGMSLNEQFNFSNFENVESAINLLFTPAPPKAYTIIFEPHNISAYETLKGVPPEVLGVFISRMMQIYSFSGHRFNRYRSAMVESALYRLSEISKQFPGSFADILNYLHLLPDRLDFDKNSCCSPEDILISLRIKSLEQDIQSRIW